MENSLKLNGSPSFNKCLFSWNWFGYLHELDHLSQLVYTYHFFKDFDGPWLSYCAKLYWYPQFLFKC